MAPTDLPEILRVAPEAETVILVGHEPDFSGLAEWLLGVSGGAVEVKKSAIAVFDLVAPRRSAGCLRALIPPKTFR
jgi:phosphohistidine phosphatase SixA